jgi:hypothetical protein
MGQLVGTAVELALGERHTVAGHRNRFGLPRCVLFDPLRYAQPTRGLAVVRAETVGMPAHEVTSSFDLPTFRPSTERWWPIQSGKAARRDAQQASRRSLLLTVPDRTPIGRLRGR